MCIRDRYYPILDTLTRTWVNAGEFGGGHSGSWVSRYKVVRDVDLVGHGYFAVMIAVHNTNTSVGLVADVTIDVALADYDSSTDTSTNIVTDSWTFKADVAAGGVEYYWFVRSFNITDRYTIPADHEIEYFIAWDTSEYDFDIYVNQENSDKPTSIGIPFDITRYGYA